MRAYFFGNMYLSSIQQGIQAAHVTSDMFVKYLFDSSTRSVSLLNWATNHKTMILLNAGYSSTIRELCELFSSNENPYAWCAFHEGDDALDGALTSVGIILPEKIYESASNIKTGSWRKDEQTGTYSIVDTRSNEYDMLMFYPHQNISEWEKQLIERMGQFGLAK